MSEGAKKVISFAGFELDPLRRRLLREGKPLSLHAKAFDVLVFLTENAGRVVSKDEILNAVWKDQFVEEANLTVQVSALRKALGERRGSPRLLITIPGKGYEFVGDIQTGPDLIIENSRVSRIVLEQTETVDDTSEDPRKLFASGVRFFTRLPVLATFVLLLLSVGGAVWIKSSGSSPRQEELPTLANRERIATSSFTVSSGGIPERVAISPDGKMLAYSSGLKRQQSLWIGEIEGAHSIQVVPLEDRQFGYLSFGPDGRYVYFTTRDSNHSRATLMRVSVFGGATEELIPDVNSPVIFSPDGRSMAFLRKNPDASQTSIIIADAESGKNDRVLTSVTRPENAVGGEISWSPDGRRIAFAVDAKEGGTKLLEVDIGDGRLAQIGDRVENRIVGVAWKPDGKGLIVNRNTSNDAGDGRLWFVRYPAGDQQQITDETLNYHASSLSISSDGRLAALQARNDPRIYTSAGGELRNSGNIFEGTRFRSEGRHGLAIAPDGKILFTANTGDSRSIWEIDAAGKGQRQLTPSQKNSFDQQLSVTADDRFLVFESNRSGASEIWRANRDGSDLRQITSGGGDIEPTLSPDGRRVYYIAERDGRSQLMSVSIDGGETQQLTAEKSYWPAVSPDGRSVAFVRSVSESGFDRSIDIVPIEGGPVTETFRVPTTAALYNRLQWSPSGKGLVYKDEFEGLWFQDLNKDRPEAIDSPEDLRIFHFAYSVDGKLVYSGGVQMREVVVLENLP